MRRSPKALAIATLSLAAFVFLTTALHADDGKWFVLRHDTTSNCWTARLIRIDGAIASGSALIAGGPYASEEEALARMSELASNGTCRTN
jgi:hypothetical protein